MVVYSVWIDDADFIGRKVGYLPFLVGCGENIVVGEGVVYSHKIKRETVEGEVAEVDFSGE